MTTFRNNKNIPDVDEMNEEQYKDYMTGTEGAPHKAEVETRKQLRNKYGGGDGWIEGARRNYLPVDEE